MLCAARRLIMRTLVPLISILILFSGKIHCEEVVKYKVTEVDILKNDVIVKLVPNKIFYGADETFTLRFCPKISNEYKSRATNALISAQGNGLLISPKMLKMEVPNERTDQEGGGETFYYCLDKIKVYSK